MSTYSLDTFVSDLKSITGQITDPKAIVEQVAPLARRLAAEPYWHDPSLRDCDPEQGFGITVLNEEDDEALMVETICWLPGCGVAPHDHQTWGVVVGIEGTEININWQRHDDGSRPDFADLSVADEVAVGAGDVCVFLPDDIHSVHNRGDTPSLSLHVYGYSPGSRNRSEFDPITKTRRVCPQRKRQYV